ncbi:MAG: N-acetylmuramoyl-L-alanine amidase [Xanthobacteraceae bacterium]
MTFLPDFKLAQANPSPNHDARTTPIDVLLLHYTGMRSGAAACRRLCETDSKVSAHYLAYEDGRIDQLVPEARRAWHAGVSAWKGETDINSCSIGIEIVNPGHEFGYRDFPEAQIEAVIALCRDVLRRHDIPRDRVLAHSDVAPGRKQDPGERFPWGRLAASGIGLWVEPTPIAEGDALVPTQRGEDITMLQTMLAKVGYAAELTGVYDDQTRDIIAAFQRHFRPVRVDGVADRSTIETLRRLLTASSAIA